MLLGDEAFPALLVSRCFHVALSVYGIEQKHMILSSEDFGGNICVAYVMTYELA